MSNKVKVNAIQIQFPDGELKHMTIEDAKSLFEQLKELFGKEPVVVKSEPVIIERQNWQIQDQPGLPNNPTIWCQADAE